MHAENCYTREDIMIYTGHKVTTEEMLLEVTVFIE